MTTLAEPRPVVILDNNAVFDWLVFDDPSCLQLAGDIEEGHVVWEATHEMIEEADTVIARGTLNAWLERHDMLRARRAALVHVVATPEPSLPTLRCTDPDDQKFIELALTRPGSVLVTRDKALLKLRRRALGRGVRIIRPSEWSETRALLAGRPQNFSDNPRKPFFEEGHRP